MLIKVGHELLINDYVSFVIFSLGAELNKCLDQLLRINWIPIVNTEFGDLNVVVLKILLRFVH
jgi:hypothetical protein